MKVILAFGGRTKLPQAREIVERFVKMSRRFLSCKVEYFKDLKDCDDLKSRYRGAIIVGLSPDGVEPDSEGFAEILKEAMDSGRDIIFAVGGAEGFSVDGCAKIISLSKMTFSHETARIMVAEQVFRALCLIFGHPYPK
ncbi:MAG: 23S rRNA (pseudouridine(1915)-N(3))-methyltransferase RlmH [Candidatus Aminicenantes bacterium]|nr:23S rRNA (pseudouridine(1915)-N(3))-methyltransferase RlmH [Candidatus Aminicenantes bacterium]